MSLPTASVLSTEVLRAEFWRREQAGLGRHWRLARIDDTALRLELEQRGARLHHAAWFAPADDRKDPLCTMGLPAPLLEHARRCCYLIGASAVRYAADGRAQLHHLHYGTANSLCPGEPFWCQPSVVERHGEYVGAFGYSGYLLSPCHILTCWHGWENFSDDTQVAIFGYQAHSPCDNPTLLPARCVYPLKLYPWATDPANESAGPDAGDWVVLELEHAVNHMPVRRMPAIAAAVPGRPVYTLGFPCGLPLKLADGATILGANSAELRCDLDTFAGNSGSPVFDALDHSLLGIVVQGQKDEGDFEPAARAGCYIGNRIDSRITGQLAVPATRFATALSRIS